MNERIKELAEQTSHIWHASGAPQIYEFTPEKLEKFAELIVRECADVCFRIDDEYDGEEVGATWCVDGILKHFGVEE